MAKDKLGYDYDQMVDEALRGVVRRVLADTATAGLPGKHHYYITFRTTFPGVRLPDYLKARFPGEMTIVLQYQFHDLTVDERTVGVTLSFNNLPERLVIPFGAITVFADPSVNFALQFPNREPKPAPAAERAPPPKPAEEPKTEKEKSGEVVSLDQFRRK